MGRTSPLTSSSALYTVNSRSLLRHRQANRFPLTNKPLVSRLKLFLSSYRGLSEYAGGVSVKGADGERQNSEVPSLESPIDFAVSVASVVDVEVQKKMLEKQLKRKAERTTYLFAAVASTVGITFLAGGAVYYRFAWQTQGSEVLWSEMFWTFSLAVGASVGMEFWARWAHKALWHDSLWSMHESHHRPRHGPFEMNDVFAIINAAPAITLMSYGFFHRGLIPGLCFGAGLGITVFGIAYMFVHDGLVHRRFPVGPLADVPYFQKVAAAHQVSKVNTGLHFSVREQRVDASASKVLHAWLCEIIWRQEYCWIHTQAMGGVVSLLPLLIIILVCSYNSAPVDGCVVELEELEVQSGGAEELEKMIQVRKKLQDFNH